MIVFRMSVKIEKRELIALARQHHEGSNDFDEVLRRCNDGFLKKMWNWLLSDLKIKYPERDFTGEKESKTRGNIMQKIKTTLKCKSHYLRKMVKLGV